MLIISKFPKSIAGHKKCSCGLGVWDLCHRHCLATTTFYLDIYLLRLKLHCNGLITIMLSVTVFINDCILTFRRKKSLDQVITIRPVQCYKFHWMLVATLLYCKREIISLPRLSQQQNLTWVGRWFSFWKCWGHWHWLYLQIVAIDVCIIDKAHVTET